MVEEQMSENPVLSHDDISTLCQLLITGKREDEKAAIGFLQAKTGKFRGEAAAYCEILRDFTESEIRLQLMSDFGWVYSNATTKEELLKQNQDNPYFPQTRTAKIEIELETYGTADQQQKSIEKFKREVALQGFKVKVCNVTA